MDSSGITDEDDFSLCVLANVRKAARAVSRHYDRFVRRVDMTGAQFSVLVAIRQASQMTTGELAEFLSMERTTLVRNIALLERKGLVISAPAGKGKSYRLADKGEQLLQDAVPLWRKAQSDVIRELGEEEFFKTVNQLKRLSQL